MIKKMSDDGYGGQVESRMMISGGWIIIGKGENVELVGGHLDGGKGQD